MCILPVGEGAMPSPVRTRLPRTRASETHKFVIGGHEGYITYGMYDNGALGEMFIKMSKQGSTLSGLLDSFAMSVSVALQYGVPLKRLVEKFIYSRFEPSGFTENPDIRIATSILDYIFRYLAMRFLPAEDLADLGLHASAKDAILPAVSGDPIVTEVSAPVAVASAPKAVFVSENGNKDKASESMCKKCGGMMVRTGTCLTCMECGDSSGGCS